MERDLPLIKASFHAPNVPIEDVVYKLTYKQLIQQLKALSTKSLVVYNEIGRKVLKDTNAMKASEFRKWREERFGKKFGDTYKTYSVEHLKKIRDFHILCKEYKCVLTSTLPFETYRAHSLLILEGLRGEFDQSFKHPPKN